jgi:hypothetical protein
MIEVLKKKKYEAYIWDRTSGYRCGGKPNAAKREIEELHLKGKVSNSSCGQPPKQSIARPKRPVGGGGGGGGGEKRGRKKHRTVDNFCREMGFHVCSYDSAEKWFPPCCVRCGIYFSFFFLVPRFFCGKRVTRETTRNQIYSIHDLIHKTHRTAK